MPWAGAAETRIPRINFQRISHEDGLSQGTVLSILQDRTGFIWIGTQAGLNRYDGQHFELFRHDPEDDESLPHEWVQVLYEDPRGDLWVGTQGGGLGRWIRSSGLFQNFRHDPKDPTSLPGNRIRAILPDGRGNLLIGTFESGLGILDPRTGRSENLRHDPSDPTSLGDDRIRSLYRDQEGRLWIGTLAGLDRMYPDGRFEHFRNRPDDPFSLNDNRVRTMMEDSEGNFWVGTFDGLHRFDPEARRFERFMADEKGLSHNRIRAIYEDREGRLWLGTDGGLNLWDHASETFFNYRQLPSDPNSLGSDQVTTIFQDEGGVLWFGTLGAGLCTWNPLGWHFNPRQNDPTSFGGPRNNVFAFAGDRDGTWFGTLGGGLAFLKSQSSRGEIPIYELGWPDVKLTDQRITSLLLDRESALWIGTLGGGLARLDSDRASLDVFEHDPENLRSLSGNAITALFQGQDGSLWIGTHGFGLNRWVPQSKSFERFGHQPNDLMTLANDRVMSLAEDAAGYLWVATDGGGLNRFDGQRFQSYRHHNDNPASLSSDNLTVVHVDDRGHLYAGTQGRGLVYLVFLNEDTGRATFDRISSRDGLVNDTVWGIESDSQGRLWVSTSGGLSRLELVEEPGSGTLRKKIKNYDTSHGLQSSEFNLGAHYRSPSGELFFGGVNGFNAFFPEEIEENTHVPPVVLTSFSVLNEPRTFDRPLTEVDSIILDHRDDFFSFEVAALDFTAPHKNRYRYRLEGFRDGWVDHENRRRIDFTSLDPGEYTLRVLGSNNDGVWNQEGLTIALTITPPFWHAWWFRIAGVWALASLILVVFRVRTRAIRRNNEKLRLLVEERTHDLEEVQERLLRKERLAVLGELAGSVAHEIRNPLGVIRNSSYFLKLTQRGKIDAKGYEHLELIEREVDQTNRIIAEMLDYARDRPAQTRPMEVRSAIGRALELVQIPDEVHLERQCADGSPRVEADPDQVERLLANLIQNAVQAMPEGGRLEVGCQGVGEQVVIHVRDQGVGIPEEDLEKIFEPLFTTKANGIGLGLALCQRYALLNGGRLECESQLGEGTEFRLLLPRIPDPEKETNPQADSPAQGPDEAWKSQTEEASHG